MIKLRRMRWAGYVAHMIQMRNAYIAVVIKPEAKTPHKTCKHKQENIS
jgi:hypothetical protein